ncbi:MAG: radical SAM protein [Bacteroidales bacterium]|jgi:wyosine [tRNA(Phe)-imidazoG37] synthetase (radical SAM superfamily)|nr:radical SAM protein [Bacteroidales bacterium]
MSTILFDEIVFGPIHSRRLGSSLGVNLLPKHGKVCSFDCLYCECGFNSDGKGDSKLPSFDEFSKALESKLEEIRDNNGRIDTITFSGNGEPTIHPDFSKIIKEALRLRRKYFPLAKVSVLTNGSKIQIPAIKEALLSVDNAIIKLDSAFDNTVNIIDRPQYKYSVADTKHNLEPYKGKFVLQTMFLRGEHDGVKIDNTTPEEVSAWRKIAIELEPREIMIYTIDRETPAKNLSKVPVEEMEQIAEPLKSLGFKVTISG